MLGRRRAAVRVGDQLYVPGAERGAPDLLAAHEQAARLVDRPADQRRAGRLGDRHRFARNHRFVDCAAAFYDDAIDGDLFARTDAQHVADRDFLERYLLVASIAADAPGEPRSEERRVGKECGSTCRSGWSPYN